MSNTAIALDGVTKTYGARKAVDELNLLVDSGSLHALLGPNGSGKTTTIRMLLGFIRPDKGQGTVLGRPFGPLYPPVDLKARIGYVSERSALYEQMTSGEILRFAREINHRWDTKTEKRYADLFRLPLDARIRHMSAGVRTQLALTLAMSARPELLILDEPTLGLDAAQRFRYLQALVEDCMEKGMTVLLASHDLYQMERIADHVTMLVSGKTVVSGALDEVKESEKRVRLAGNLDQSNLAGLPGVRKVSQDSRGMLLCVKGDIEAFKAAARKIPGITGMQVMDQSLEEIFLSYAE